MDGITLVLTNEIRYEAYRDRILDIPYSKWVILDTVCLSGQNEEVMDLAMLPDSIESIRIDSGHTREIRLGVPLPNLKSIKVTRTRLEVYDVGDFTPNIVTLNLSQNNLRTITLGEGNLYHLDLHDNQLEILEMKHNRLEMMTLDVSNNPLLRALPKLGTFVSILATNTTQISNSDEWQFDIVL